MARRYPKSQSGRYDVTLTRPFTHLGFTYRPGAVNVREGLLKTMLDEEGLVANVGASS
jgi:hypothetical protein